MKRYLFTSIWGVGIWFFATLFFVFFGENVLFSPGSTSFVFSLILLLLGTGILLLGLTYVYLRYDKSENAALRFGVIGTIIGLSLDTISLSNHTNLFPKLENYQVIAFTAWMSFAYALYLIIPLVVSQLNRK
ncbi:DUF5367 family protein [Fredinandcohnia humi]